MNTETRQVQTPDGPMRVYVARPDEQPSRAVIVIQEAYGVNEHIEDVTRRAASAGYLSVAPDLFHRSGGGSVAYDNREGIWEHFKALDDRKVLDDIDAALSLIESEGISERSTGIVGFCIGGRMVFLASTQRALGAGVTFYGGGIFGGRSESMPSLLPGIAKMQTPWLGLFGDEDAGIPIEEVEQLRTALAKDARVETEIVRYPGAQHGFHCDARPKSYDAEAAADAWRRTLDWFDRHLR
jgi:carboxymethylenebutenolidase